MQKTAGLKFCHECGEQINVKAEICPKCGVRQPVNELMAQATAANPQHSIVGQGEPRQKGTAAALAVLVGGIGAHKFYLGQPMWGIVYVVMCWTFIPMILGVLEGLSLWMMKEDAFAKKFGGPAWAKGKPSALNVPETPTADTHVHCPECRELVRKDAKVCRFCGTKLIPQSF